MRRGHSGLRCQRFGAAPRGSALGRALACPRLFVDGTGHARRHARLDHGPQAQDRLRAPGRRGARCGPGRYRSASIGVRRATVRQLPLSGRRSVRTSFRPSFRNGSPGLDRRTPLHAVLTTDHSGWQPERSLPQPGAWHARLDARARIRRPRGCAGGARFAIRCVNARKQPPPLADTGNGRSGASQGKTRRLSWCQVIGRSRPIPAVP